MACPFLSQFYPSWRLASGATDPLLCASTSCSSCRTYSSSAAAARGAADRESPDAAAVRCRGGFGLLGPLTAIRPVPHERPRCAVEHGCQLPLRQLGHEHLARLCADGPTERERQVRGATLPEQEHA